MLVERVHPSGTWRISALLGSSLVTRVFIRSGASPLGYTRREAIAAFRAEICGSAEIG